MSIGTMFFLAKWSLIIGALIYIGLKVYNPIKNLVLKIKGLFSKGF